jgi:hypothetical protein
VARPGGPFLQEYNMKPFKQLRVTEGFTVNSQVELTGDEATVKDVLNKAGDELEDTGAFEAIGTVVLACEDGRHYAGTACVHFEEITQEQFEEMKTNRDEH